jgi:hypothetical protein
MLGDLISGLMGGMDKESITKDTIQDTLEKVSAELNAPFNNFFITIQAVDDKFNFKCDIFQIIENKKVHVRMITIAEIVGKKDE